MGCGASAPQATAPEVSSEPGKKGDLPTLDISGKATENSEDVPSPSKSARGRDCPPTARGSTLGVDKTSDGKIRIKWSIKGEKRAGDGDWIGAFEGPARRDASHLQNGANLKQGKGGVFYNIDIITTVITTHDLVSIKAPMHTAQLSTGTKFITINGHILRVDPTSLVEL